MINSHRDLVIWQSGIELAVHIYRMTRSFPTFERYGLASQLQRAASSIPANIAEGHGRRTKGDFRRSLAIARGSAAELSTHLALANRLGYISKEMLDEFEDEAGLVARRITVLIRRLPRSR